MILHLRWTAAIALVAAACFARDGRDSARLRAGAGAPRTPHWTVELERGTGLRSPPTQTAPS